MSMPVPDWVSELSLESLPEQYQMMAREIGVENTIKIANLFQGTGFYLPKLDGLLNDIRNKRIRDEFTGNNYKELARKYDLTERWIYEIIGKEIDETQTSLFS